MASAPGNPHSRRKFLATLAGSVAAGASLPLLAHASTVSALKPAEAPDLGSEDAPEHFWGTHQGGIATTQQTHTYFAAFDVTAKDRDSLIRLLQAWTAGAERLTRGLPADSSAGANTASVDDSLDAVDLSSEKLTLTFGFGSSLFLKDQVDRFGIAHQFPEALGNNPSFNGDQLVAGQTGGDLSVQACANDPQVAFHAVRQLASLASGSATLRWSQTGYLPGRPSYPHTRRNLMGFKDGTGNNVDLSAVWVGAEGPAWMQGGSYAAVRKIRFALEHWDRMKAPDQEAFIGREKVSGAPLGGQKEFDAANFHAKDASGNFVIPQNAHVRLASPQNNGGASMLRRGYSYNDGLSFTAERWPPWRQGQEYDAGLLFIAYQKDIREGFQKVFSVMSKRDALNQFTTHVGGGYFACPPGAAEGEFIGQGLFAG